MRVQPPLKAEFASKGEIAVNLSYNLFLNLTLDKDLKIAFFDSGIGGLSVLAEALGRFSGAEFLYFADEDHVPYGTKSRAEIVRLSLDAVGFLVSHGAEAVVIACNTATSAAISELRGAFSVPIIGMEPAVKLAADRYGSRPTLLIATPLTIAGEKLARLVGRLECETWSLPLPRLVEFAQDLEFDSPAVRTYLQGELGKFELARLGSLVLGCTHFNYFKDVLREILPPHVRIIDGIDGTLNRLVSELAARGKNLRAAERNLLAEAGRFGAFRGGSDVNFVQKHGKNTANSAQGSGGDTVGRLINSNLNGANTVLNSSQKDGIKFRENIALNFDPDGTVKFELCDENRVANGAVCNKRDDKFKADTSDETGKFDGEKFNGGEFDRDLPGKFGGNIARARDGLEKISESTGLSERGLSQTPYPGDVGDLLCERRTLSLSCGAAYFGLDDAGEISDGFDLTADGSKALCEQGGTNSKIATKRGVNDCDTGSRAASGKCKNSEICYPNGNSVEYFYSGRALDAAWLGRIELFLARLEKMWEID